jgi:hypothetical protein
VGKGTREDILGIEEVKERSVRGEKGEKRGGDGRKNGMEDGE